MTTRIDETQKFCKECRYQLAGLRRNACPECGRPFDPDDATSYHERADGSHPIPRASLRAAASVYALWLFWMLVLAAMAGRSVADTTAAILAVVTLGIGSATVLVPTILMRHSARFCVAALIIGIVLAMSIYICMAEVLTTP